MKSVYTNKNFIITTNKYINIKFISQLKRERERKEYHEKSIKLSYYLLKKIIAGTQQTINSSEKINK